MRAVRWVAFAALIALASVGTAGAQNISIADLPMYGGVEKNAEMREIDRKFIDGVLSTGHTRQTGAKAAAERGFQFFHQGDYRTAIRRFNQAWLLDPDNPEAHHGFALVVLERDKDPAGGEAFFRKALSYPGVNPGAHADYGLLLLRGNRIAEALEVLQSGLEKAPDMPSLRSHHAVALFLSGDVRQGCKATAAAFERAGPGERPTMGMILDSEECRSRKN